MPQSDNFFLLLDWWREMVPPAFLLFICPCSFTFFVVAQIFSQMAVEDELAKFWQLYCGCLTDGQLANGGSLWKDSARLRHIYWLRILFLTSIVLLFTLLGLDHPIIPCFLELCHGCIIPEIVSIDSFFDAFFARIHLLVPLEVAKFEASLS